MDRLSKIGHPLGVSFKQNISPLLLTYIILCWSLFTYLRHQFSEKFFNSIQFWHWLPRASANPTGKGQSSWDSRPHFRWYVQLRDTCIFYQPAAKSEFPQLHSHNIPVGYFARMTNRTHPKHCIYDYSFIINGTAQEQQMEMTHR